MMNVTFAIPEPIANSVFLPEDYERLSRLARIVRPPTPGLFSWTEERELLARTGILITGWRTPRLDEALLPLMPELALVANASGAVKGHLPLALWERGIQVVTASSALGWGVAEFALALILLASKRAFWLAQSVRQGEAWQEQKDCFGGGFELYGADVGIIGAGQSGRHLLRLLAPFGCRLWVYDPFVDQAALDRMGAPRTITKAVSLEELFERCRVVSLHASLTDASRHLLRGHHFRRLPAGAVFVNTARAGLVHEAEFIEALRSETFVACVDVASQEPPPADHPLRHLSNVILTPHVAGAIRQNRFRMGRLIVDEIERYLSGQPLQHEVVLNNLCAIA